MYTAVSVYLAIGVLIVFVVVSYRDYDTQNKAMDIFQSYSPVEVFFGMLRLAVLWPVYFVLAAYGASKRRK